MALAKKAGEYVATSYAAAPQDVKDKNIESGIAAIAPELTTRSIALARAAPFKPLAQDDPVKLLFDEFLSKPRTFQQLGTCRCLPPAPAPSVLWCVVAQSPVQRCRCGELCGQVHGPSRCRCGEQEALNGAASLCCACPCSPLYRLVSLLISAERSPLTLRSNKPFILECRSTPARSSPPEPQSSCCQYAKLPDC